MNGLYLVEGREIWHEYSYHRLIPSLNYVDRLSYEQYVQNEYPNLYIISGKNAGH